MPLISSLGVMNAINFGLASSVSSKSMYVAFALDNTTNNVGVYKWNNSTGFGTLTAGSTTLGSAAYGVAFSPNNAYIARSTYNSSQAPIQVNPWSASGFGTSVTSPTTMQYQGQVAFNPSSNVVVYVGYNTPYVKAHPWAAGSFGTVYTAPTTTPGGAGYGVTFNPTGTVLSVASGGANYMFNYAWSAGFGTKYANPATSPTGVGHDIKFNASNNLVAVSHETSPYLSIYPWSDATGCGTKYANPGTILPNGIGKTCNFNPDSSAAAFTFGNNSPYIAVYAWSSGFGAKFSDPATIPSFANTAKFNAANNVLMVGAQVTPFCFAYGWGTGGFGSKFANPSTLLTATQIYDISFSY